MPEMSNRSRPNGAEERKLHRPAFSQSLYLPPVSILYRRLKQRLREKRGKKRAQSLDNQGFFGSRSARTPWDAKTASGTRYLTCLWMTKTASVFREAAFRIGTIRPWHRTTVMIRIQFRFQTELSLIILGGSDENDYDDYWQHYWAKRHRFDRVCLWFKLRIILARRFSLNCLQTEGALRGPKMWKMATNYTKW